MSIELIMRIAGLLLFGLGGLALGGELAQWLPARLVFNPLYIVIPATVLGALLGFWVTPWMTTRPFRRLREVIQHLPAHLLVPAILGLAVGLIFGVITAYPISLLPSPFGEVLPFVVAAVFGYLGVLVTTSRPDLLQALRERFGSKEVKSESPKLPAILLDTSVIIDGRIADICRTGFIQGELVIPLFVLNELQHIADSPDAMRRNRGRRGLEILRQLQEDAPVPVRLLDTDVEGVREVDDKLVTLARQLGASILTNDYNLNRVAELQGVTVLNVNELANAVKTVLLPGESFVIYVMQEGKESDQGVGYLDDGTMVVVEEGRSFIGQTTQVMVSKVLQTAAGRMIFARPANVTTPIA